MRTKSYGNGENLPPGVCPCCRKRKIKRSGLGTCGGRTCIAEMNARAMKPTGYGDRYESGGGTGSKVKIDGRGKAMPVVGSKTVKGTHCYIVNTGKGRMTIPIERCEEQ